MPSNSKSYIDSTYRISYTSYAHIVYTQSWRYQLPLSGIHANYVTQYASKMLVTRSSSVTKISTACGPGTCEAGKKPDNRRENQIEKNESKRPAICYNMFIYNAFARNYSWLTIIITKWKYMPYGPAYGECKTTAIYFITAKSIITIIHDVKSRYDL